MNIQTIQRNFERRTAADDIFEQLRSEIVSLRLKPGTRISEVEFANQFDVSRQPVREAFIRLSKMNLLEIRPQKATLVRKISEREILHARFLRVAVEVEVIRLACKIEGNPFQAGFEENLNAQESALSAGKVLEFHDLDYDFHNLICATAQCEFAFDTIADSKTHVDRLCLISLSTERGMYEIFQDHQQLYQMLQKKDAVEMERLIRLHICRLDQTLADARERHPDYFQT
ncbi:MAG: GntR family transcriptional regulator [Alphaproteobacteria bacterium]